MEQFRIRPDGFKELKKKMLLRGVLLFGVAITVAVFSIVIKFDENGISTDLSTLPFMIPGMAVLVGFAMYKGINRQKILFDSYVLTFSDNLITREQFNTTTLSLHTFEIKDIVKDKKGHFWIKGNDIIIVPNQIERYEEVEALLNKITPITTKVSAVFKFRGVIAIIALGCMFCLYTMNNKIVVGICGTVVTGILVWNLYERWKYRNSMDKKTQRTAFVYVLILLFTVAVTVMKLAGYYDLV